MLDAATPETPAPALHPSADPARLRDALMTALRARRLPGRALYESAEQARRWLAYHAAYSPSRDEAVLHALYGAAFAAAAAAQPAGALGVVGLGCGGGGKDSALLAALAATGRHAPLHYGPLDASAALVREAARRAAAQVPGLRVAPLVADLEAAPELAAWLTGMAPAAPETPRLLTCFGMLPNMEPRTFPRWLAGLLRPRDGLLISANLSPGGLAADGARILAQYDNAPAREWYAGALGELGLPADAYALACVAEALPGTDPRDAWRIAVRAELRRALTLTLHDERMAYTAGERLAVFHSLRYSTAGVTTLLADAGLRADAHWLGAAGEEGVFLCRRAQAT